MSLDGHLYGLHILDPGHGDLLVLSFAGGHSGVPLRLCNGLGIGFRPRHAVHQFLVIAAVQLRCELLKALGLVESNVVAFGILKIVGEERLEHGRFEVLEEEGYSR